ncbi:MAG: hypothetical protein JHD16_18095, partial [Solirubrobacteraceae bacterium]|nr:hypothetical protein [Solirubrobacteraceae bacterium]
EVPIFRDLALSVGAGGSSLATWVSGNDAATKFQGAVRTVTGDWEPWALIADAPRGTADGMRLGSTVVDAAGRATAVWHDGPRILSRSITLVDPPVTPVPPKPEDPKPADPTPPAPENPAPTAPNPPAPAAPTPSAAPAPNGTATKPQSTPVPKLVIAMYVVPSGKKCPAAVAGTVNKVRTALKVKATKLRGKVRCKVTGTILLPAATKVGTKVSVLVTAKGIKRKTIQVAATP